MTKGKKTQNALAELNRIAAKELSGPKRHKHIWVSDEPIKRGESHTFHCTKCPTTKTVNVPAN